MGLGGAELLTAAARAASRNGLYVVSMYLEKAAIEHQRKGCPSEVAPCAYEIEASRVLLSGF
ncbi:hypothetical protein C8D88_113248 [Lentzea atacamensis]|jgi:hypothetical protein|uniref:Uncharacterized protein n=2 Tax=Lentzea TaxID=165301 RepID=A0A316HRB5_9PSEU|nr:hypothetical protein [Lentzea atacamensis]PWK82655.1 hypothetical protein C8D88_113248 [Lentzea atacamensis]RAS63068.1 hypothetical protein C8D87_107217 [Lentzea atacamensis]